MEVLPRISKVQVVYYLSRNGQLEQPHFMEVPLHTADGLYLRDVLRRLDFLRGEGMASMYAWSSKRSYRNGFVWHDLAEDDLIYPTHGLEYVLKGCEFMHHSPSPEMQKVESEHPLARKKKAPSRSFDLGEYKVYKNELTVENAVKVADASTQTDDRNRRRRDHAVDVLIQHREENSAIELVRDEISPPTSSSSSEIPTKANGGAINAASGARGAGCRTSASAVLMRMISCGSFSLSSQYRGRMPRGGAKDEREAKEMDGRMDIPSFSGLGLEGKEYFSGSLVETIKKKKKPEGDRERGGGSGGHGEFPALRRSSSCNTERSWTFELEVKKKGFPKQQITENEN
ncbi:hypothetical protein HPP92_014318 [Vanilla planifolia]|uniref:SOSEKI DIX-like domain-containing protein n=1 Tax=Vanilla planifolia TaxID=51239 RepID=A0A835R132_VANPL|nr:hypothetical protein HPP92_014318 [Vanilla planifolia]